MLGYRWIKVNDSRRDGDATTMKIKAGYNNKEDKYYINITDRRTLESFRFYMDEGQFNSFANFQLFVIATTKAQKENIEKSKIN